MPSLLRKKERSAAAEAARQSEILTQIEHQREMERARQRDQLYENAHRRQQMWLDQEREREEKRMAAMAREQQAKREREQRQREAQAAVNQQNAEAYKAAKAEVENIDRTIAQLRGSHDLSTVEGALAASEQQAKVSALQELRKGADSRLLRAERLVGIHRNGGI